MSFTKELEENFLQEAKNINIASFLDKVDQYPNLDAALIDLPGEYLEFFMNNEKKLQKALGKMFEAAASAEGPGYVGWSPADKRIVKMIKYKGNLIRMEYDPEYKVWDASAVFRNVTAAVRFGKKDVEDNAL